MTGSMIEWLRNQVDEDELAARALNIDGRTPARRGASPPPRWIYKAPEIREPGDPEVVVVKFVRPREAAHITRHDPARVMREVAFKRAVLKAHSSVLSQRIDGVMRDTCIACQCELTRFDYPCPPLRQLAAVYSDRPGYLDEWKP